MSSVSVGAAFVFTLRVITKRCALNAGRNWKTRGGKAMAKYEVKNVKSFRGMEGQG